MLLADDSTLNSSLYPSSSAPLSKFELLLVAPFFPRDDIGDLRDDTGETFSKGRMRFAAPPPRVACRCDGGFEVMDVLFREVVLLLKDDGGFRDLLSSSSSNLLFGGRPRFRLAFRSSSSSSSTSSISSSSCPPASLGFFLLFL